MMILGSIIKNLRRHDWFVVVMEVTLLAIGLLAAFQIDRWWEARADREKERVYLQRLIDEVAADIPSVQGMIEMQSIRLDFADLLITVSQDPQRALERPGEFLAAVIGASYTNYPVLREHTFQELRSTGNLAVIRSAAIKSALFDYYERDRQQGNFVSLFLSIELRHQELAAGIRTTEQALWLQENQVFALVADMPFLLESEHDPDEILIAAQRLANRHELVDWLPQVREMQIYLLFSMERQVARSEALLNELRAYAAEIGTPRAES